MKIQKQLYKAFGLRVRSLRTHRKLTQLQLSKATRMVRTSVCNIEAGRQRVFLDDILTFSTALKVQPGELLRGVWKPKVYTNGKARK